MLGSVSGEETTTNLDEIVTAVMDREGRPDVRLPAAVVPGRVRHSIRSLAAGDVDTDAFVSTTIDPDDVVEEGFEAPADADGEHVKALVSP